MTKKSDAPAIRFKGFSDAWEQRKLGELGTITTGNTPSTSIPDYYSDDGIVWVTPTDICENITFESARKLSDLGQQVGRVVPKNTILVTCIASIGKNTMLGNTGSFNQQINGLTPNENKYDPYFLLTESALWSAKMKGSAASGTMQIVNRTEFSELKTWLPSLIEQQAIGAFFKQLDNLITLHQRKFEKLTNVKKSMLEKMFPQNGSSYPEIRFKGFTDPWEQRKLGDISEIKTGPFGSTLHADDYVSDGTPIITTEHFKTGALPRSKNGLPQVSDSDYKRLTAYTLDDGDIVFSRVGSVDINALITPFQSNWLFSGRVLRVRPQTDISSKFLHTRLETESIKTDIRTRAVGQTMPSINTEILKITPLVLPSSAAEQKQIGSYFAALDHLITLHQRELEKLQNIKKSMLEKMFV